jgi:CheY-like chemotaxis protein
LKNNGPDRARSSTSPSPQVDAATSPVRIWLVEDSPTDAFVIEEALRASGLRHDTQAMRDGELAVAAIRAVSAGEAPAPHLVLLDLNLPRVSGLQVLATLRKTPELQHVPVVVVTSSDFKGDRDAVAEHGISGYFCKPHDLDEFLTLGDMVKQVLG